MVWDLEVWGVKILQFEVSGVVGMVGAIAPPASGANSEAGTSPNVSNT